MIIVMSLKALLIKQAIKKNAWVSYRSNIL